MYEDEVYEECLDCEGTGYEEEGDECIYCNGEGVVPHDC